MRNDLVYIDERSDLVFGDECSIILPTMRSEIFCSLPSLVVEAEGRDFGCMQHLFHGWASWPTELFDCRHNCVD